MVQDEVEFLNIQDFLWERYEKLFNLYRLYASANSGNIDIKEVFNICYNDCYDFAKKSKILDSHLNKDLMNLDLMKQEVNPSVRGSV